MLLAAGLGTRLRPWTEDRPKCMVPVAGKPVLQRNLEWLRSQGVGEVVINLHLHAQVVTEHFADGQAFGVHIDYSYERGLMGTAGALWMARDFFAGSPFWVVYGDNLFDFDLKRVSEVHLANQALLTMALFWRQDVSASGVVHINEAGRVLGFKEKPRPEEISSHWVNAGLYLCEPRVMDFIPPGQTCDFGHDILPAMLSAGEPLYGYPMGAGETLYWIDTPEDLARTVAALQR
jgi:mannose-1-phosphate guanylyltransferase